MIKYGNNRKERVGEVSVDECDIRDITKTFMNYYTNIISHDRDDCDTDEGNNIGKRPLVAHKKNPKQHSDSCKAPRMPHINKRVDKIAKLNDENPVNVNHDCCGNGGNGLIEVIVQEMGWG